MNLSNDLRSESHPIALLTDFGVDDWYVAALKGEILRRLPGAAIIDVSHSVSSHHIQSGAFQLSCVLDSMPEGTVFCCVVDPGVGTARRSICGRVGRWFFSGPDNGLVTPLLNRAGEDFELHEIESEDFSNPEVSATFQGRDLFAPAAARLAGGSEPAQAGPPVGDPIRLDPLEPQERPDGIVAEIMLADHFGNLVTNLPRSRFASRLTPGSFRIRAGTLTLDDIRHTFGDVRHIEALAYWGSCGMLEIGVNLGSAADLTNLSPGDVVFVEWLPTKG